MFHIVETGCALVLQRDLEYWSIDELVMEPCCALKYYPQIDVCQERNHLKTTKENISVCFVFYSPLLMGMEVLEVNTA